MLRYPADVGRLSNQYVETNTNNIPSPLLFLLLPSLSSSFFGPFHLFVLRLGGRMHGDLTHRLETELHSQARS
ncbi:hypothetical protein BJ546DRAFT_1080701 [Cryomyces antarcticus]